MLGSADARAWPGFWLRPCGIYHIVQINTHYICKVLVKSSEECCTNCDIQEKDKEKVIIALV